MSTKKCNVTDNFHLLYYLICWNLASFSLVKTKAQARTRTHTHTRTPSHIQTHTHTHTHSHTLTQTHTHTHKHTHTHTHTHTHMYISTDTTTKSEHVLMAEPGLSIGDADIHLSCFPTLLTSFVLSLALTKRTFQSGGMDWLSMAKPWFCEVMKAWPFPVFSTGWLCPLQHGKKHFQGECRIFPKFKDHFPGWVQDFPKFKDYFQGEYRISPKFRLFSRVSAGFSQIQRLFPVWVQDFPQI